jgi:hypothetical protein
MIHYLSLNNGDHNYEIKSFQVTSNINLESKSTISEAPLSPLIMQAENIHSEELYLLDIMLCSQLKFNRHF